MKKITNTKYKNFLKIRNIKSISLTSPRYREELEEIAEVILKEYDKNTEKLQIVFDDFQKLKMPITLRIAAKLALSYSLTRTIDKEVCVSVVFPVYNEKNRLHRSKDHPHGENFLRVKINQLNKLASLNKNIHWRMIIVDDGSSDGTGHIINFILENEYPTYLQNKKVQVIFMKDALKKNLSYLEYVRDIKKSGKGSSILYGMDHAVKSYESKKTEEHILCYTDADLSVHLGQIGMVVHQILTDDCDAVIGQRRLKDSVTVRPKLKSARGKLYLFLLKQVIPLLKGSITDTQAPFKVMKEKAFKSVLKLMREPGFGFDVELLILLKLLGFRVCNYGLCFIDSNKSSHTNSSSVHLKMLKNILNVRKRHIPRVPASPEYEKFIKELTITEWKTLTERIPDYIRRANPARIDKLSVSPTELKQITK
ncbi:MAG: glycosyltransferase family 2 protein [Weeksellaceae bacterium]